MKIVFTDFDGVLNSTPYTSELLRKIRERPAGATASRKEEALDETNVAILDALCLEADAELVVSSSWREVRTLAELWAMLLARGFRGRVRGKTPTWVLGPYGAKAGPERGDEIQAWLSAAPNFGIVVDSFVILDDQDDMAHLADRLVRTDPGFGLTVQDASSAKKLLGSPQPMLMKMTPRQLEKFGG